MANISYEEILSIQRKANIVDIIRDYVPLTQRGKNYFGICPFHDDHNPSMSVSPEKGVYKCFVCGNAGNVFNFVMEYEKVSFYEAVKIVADKIGVSIDISTSKKENTKKSPLYDIYNISYKFYQNNLNTVYGKDAKKYLLNRKIDEDVIKNFNIGLSLSDSELCNALKTKGFKDDDIVSSGVAVQNGNNIYDIYKNRIMFPLYDLEGSVVGFSGRIYNQKSESKYINTKETEIFKKGELLYNYHIAKKEARKEKNIIVVEGFMDVIRLSTIGIVLLGSIFNVTDSGKRPLTVVSENDDTVVATGQIINGVTLDGQSNEIDSDAYPLYIIFKKVNNTYKIDMFE